jgi:transposase-like protein
MRENRPHNDDEVTRAAMRLVTAHGYGVGETARHLGIHANRLSRWK